MGGQPLFTGAEIAAKIERGEALFISGDAALLRRLPRGRWIGGTSPEFGAEPGGALGRERAWAFALPDCALGAELRRYDAASLPGVYGDAPDNGYSLIVIPAASRVLRSFALGAPRYESFACRPLVGWVSGVALTELGAATPLVFDGRDGTAHDDDALVMHVTLPKTMSAKLDFVNIFEPGEGPLLEFPEDGFSAREVSVDGGRPRPFAAYVKERGLDLRLPLVADYNGAMVNTSFQSVDESAGEVRFYGPVFRGVRYRQARPVGDYRAAFSAQFPETLGPRTAYACNCILNYLYAGFDVGQGAGPMGPATFGEVAYQLLNQTLVYLNVGEANLAERLCGTCALRKRYYALEALADDLEAFNAMAAHDLRAPLRHISAYATLLRQAPASDESVRLTERITDGVARMQTLLDALLAFSRAGRGPLLDEPVDLGELVASVRRDLEADPDAGRAEWRIAPLPLVRGDRGLLRQVVVNLLSNALKYSRGRPQPRIEVGVQRKDGRPVVYVRDNGVGFAAEDAKRLFKPFSRLHTAAEYPGTGLGLASADRIIARHGGWVRGEGEPGRGACFYFSLPGP